MATQLSKADRIRAMLNMMSNKDIAEAIGCSDAYVRAVRQRTSPSGNPIETVSSLAWKLANPGRVKRYAEISMSRRRRAEARA